jgi:hypothetical protein
LFYRSSIPSNTDRLVKQDTIKSKLRQAIQFSCVGNPMLRSYTLPVHAPTTWNLPQPTYHFSPLPGRKSTVIKVSSRTILIARRVARSARTTVVPIVTIMRRRLYVAALRRATYCGVAVAVAGAVRRGRPYGCSKRDVPSGETSRYRSLNC